VILEKIWNLVRDTKAIAFGAQALARFSKHQANVAQLSLRMFGYHHISI